MFRVSVLIHIDSEEVWITTGHIISFSVASSFLEMMKKQENFTCGLIEQYDMNEGWVLCT